MKPKKIIDELKINKHIFNKILLDTSNELFLWKPNRDNWCLLEIVCHLYDEEREDFRSRTDQILKNPDLPFSPIDPVGWVQERGYIKKDYDIMLKKFLIERDSSIEWLKSLDKPKWTNAYKHPKLGSLSAKMFLTNWLAHDYLHIRQILKLKYLYLEHLSDESITYAGAW